MKQSIARTRATWLLCALAFVTLHVSRFTPAAPATQPSTQPAIAAKPIFDAMQFAGKPADVGLPIVYMAYDGTFNRATTPVAANNSPAADAVGRIRQEVAWRRLARAALGLEPDIPQHALFYPAVSSTICLDLEDPKIMAALDAAAEPAQRRAMVAWLVKRIRILRDEAAQYDRTLTIGCYMFPPSLYGLQHPADARRPAWEVGAAMDLAPLVKAVDRFYVEGYCHNDDFAAWQKSLSLAIGRCRALDPDKPVYVFVTPVYSHFAADNLRWRLLSTDLWRNLIAAARDASDGVVIWNVTDPADPTGVRLWKWNDESPWWLAVKELAGTR